MFDIEKAIQLVADIGLRPAARHYGLNHATLACRIKAYKAKQSPAPEAEQPQAAPPSTAEPIEQPQAEGSFGGRWRTIRRHTDETRKQLGLPPLTDKEWEAEKLTIEQCEKAMEHFWPSHWKQQ